MGRCSEVDDLSMNDKMTKPLTATGRRASVVVNTSAWHATVRGSIPGPDMLYFRCKT